MTTVTINGTNKLFLNLNIISKFEIFCRIWQTTDKRELPVANRVVLKSAIHRLHQANRLTDEYLIKKNKFWERAKARQTKIGAQGIQAVLKLEITSVYILQIKSSSGHIFEII